MNKCLRLLFLLLFIACTNRPNSRPVDQSGDATMTRPVSISKAAWGALPDGTPLELYTLKNAQGMTLTVTNYGGIITSWTAPDRQGQYEDVVLGYDSIDGYLRETPYFGALIGRYGNRIAQGKFSLDGQAYTLAVNNIGNHLHGGLRGFDKVVWQAEVLPTPDSVASLQLTYRSPDMEEGYPGNLQATVVYTLDQHDALHIRYEAITDRPTVVNLTQHSYFNLTAGQRDILEHRLQLQAGRFLPVDKTLIPTGELRPVRGTVFDFMQPTGIGARIDDTSDQQIVYGGGYDHAWVLDRSGPGLSRAAAVLEPVSGRYLEVWTTEPAIQFYAGNFLDGSIRGKKGVVYGHRFGFCLETEHYPDSPNQPTFPSTVLRPGAIYRTETVYRFGVR